MVIRETWQSFIHQVQTNFAVQIGLLGQLHRFLQRRLRIVGSDLSHQSVQLEEARPNKARSRQGGERPVSHGADPKLSTLNHINIASLVSSQYFDAVYLARYSLSFKFCLSALHLL